MKKIAKNVVALMSATLISVCTCNGIFAFANDKSIDIEELTTQNIELKAENKRLTNLVSQYGILVNSLQTENDNLKAALEEVEESQENNKTYLGEFNLSYYCIEKYPHNCGGGGITASGNQVQAYHTVAVDTSIIPLGTKLYIEDVGIRVAEDTGGAIKGHKIDVAVASHDEALALGIKSGVKVWIIEE